MKKLIVGILLALACFGAGAQSPVVSSTCTTTSVTVTNASQALVAANGLRRWIMIQNNDGAGNVFLAFGSTAATTALIKIAPAANITFSSVGIPTQTINLIGSIASNANVAIVECS